MRKLFSFFASIVYLIGSLGATFDPTPTVWRKAESELATIHTTLSDKLQGMRPAQPHNRALALLKIPHKKEDVFCPPQEYFKSNHLYTERDEELSKKKAEKDLSKARANIRKSSQSIQSGKSDTSPELEELNERAENLKMAATIMQEKIIPLKRVREQESLYFNFYPFPTHMNRMLDSEVSICKKISEYFQNLNLSGSPLVFLHIHTDNNPCFCCVQTLHHFCKVWSQQYNISLQAYVSSNKEYVWKGALPSEHIVPSNSDNKPSMRKYGQDDRYDQSISEQEIKNFTYTTDNKGQIIQIFLP